MAKVCFAISMQVWAVILKYKHLAQVMKETLKKVVGKSSNVGFTYLIIKSAHIRVRMSSGLKDLYKNIINNHKVLLIFFSKPEFSLLFI